MVDVGIFTKNADIQARAGANASATLKLTAETDKYVLDKESIINVRSRTNWSDIYSTLNVDVAGILKDTGALMCATEVVKADMSGYTSLEEARLMLNVMNNQINLNISILKDKGQETFMKAA